MSKKRARRRGAVWSGVVVLATLWCAVAGAAVDAGAAQVELVRVWPEKIYVPAGEPVRGTATIQNTGEQPASLTVEACLISGIDAVSGLQRLEVDVAAGAEQSLSFEWPAGQVPLYGQAMRVRLLQGNEVVAEGEEFFGVADCYWDVCLLSTDPYMTGRRSKEQISAEVMQWRTQHYNGREKFFWAPDDFCDMTPDVEEWRSGQGRYYENRSHMKHMIEEGHKLGLAFITYGKCVGYGPRVLEYFRRRPENARGYGGALAFQHAAWKLTRWQTEEYFSPDVRFYPNFDDPKVIEHGINEIIGSTKMFGWDGVRFDGHFTVIDDERNAEIDRMMKERIRKEFPNFVFGYNYHRPKTAIESRPLETRALLEGGGLIMNEYIKVAARPDHVWHEWDKFTDVLLEDVGVARKFGGYVCAVNSGNLSPYRTAFMAAAGAHPYYGSHFRPFITRYNVFFWDRALERIQDPQRLLEVSETVWWKKWVHMRPARQGRRQIVLHLFAPPASEGVDDSDSELRDPVKNVQVTVDPTALEGDWIVRRAAFLDPEAVRSRVLELKAAGGNKRSFLVPSVDVWGVVVMDLEKG